VYFKGVPEIVQASGPTKPGSTPVHVIWQVCAVISEKLISIVRVDYMLPLKCETAQHSISHARRWLFSYSLLWDFQNLQCHSYFKLSALICGVSFLWVCILDLLSMQRVNPKIHFSCGVFTQTPLWTWVKFSIRGLCVTLLSLLNVIAYFSTGTCSVCECINEIFHVLFVHRIMNCVK